MNTLIKFFLTFKTLFFFLLLQFICLLLIVNNNQFQRVRILNSSNVVVGYVYKLSNSVYEYFGLNLTNELLARENTALKNELYECKAELERMKNDTNFVQRKSYAEKNRYSFITAKVINASVYKERNYITIDKGLNDGVRADMGVVSQTGVVGIVQSVSRHFSVIIPIICTENFNISAKIKGKDNVGSLTWNGGDYRTASLGEILQHVEVRQNDTVVTSGYSSIFPAGMMVGTIKDFEKGDEFYDIDVLLSTDFANLDFVDVIDYKYRDEQKELEEKK